MAQTTEEFLWRATSTVVKIPGRKQIVFCYFPGNKPENRDRCGGGGNHRVCRGRRAATLIRSPRCSAPPRHCLTDITCILPSVRNKGAVW